MAIILVGIAIASLLAANRSFTQTTGAGTELSTAEFLTEQIRELTALLPVIDPQTGTTTFGPETGEILSSYDDLDDFNGAVFSPPINAGRQSLSDFAAFRQQVTVENVSNTNFQQVVGHHTSSFVRVTVKALLNGREISSAGWIRARY